jgi:hypothetical protein
MRYSDVTAALVGPDTATGLISVVTVGDIAAQGAKD